MWICYIVTADEGNIHISFHVKERQKKISGWVSDTLLKPSATLQIKSPATKKGFIPLTEAMETSGEGWNAVFLDAVHVSPPQRSSNMFQLNFLKICSKQGWEKPWERKKKTLVFRKQGSFPKKRVSNTIIVSYNWIFISVLPQNALPCIEQVSPQLLIRKELHTFAEGYCFACQRKQCVFSPKHVTTDIS